jgi:hypothetical protein
MPTNRKDKIPAKEVVLNEHGFKKRVRTTKDDIIDATTMLEKGHSVGVIAKRLGLSNHQVVSIRDKRVELKNHTDIVKDVLGDFWYTLADAALSKVTEEKLEALSVPQLVTVAAIATDKARLLEGKPTEIVAAYEAVVKKFILVDETARAKHDEKNRSNSIDVPFSVSNGGEQLLTSDDFSDTREDSNSDDQGGDN